MIKLAIIDKYPIVRIGVKIFLKDHFPEIVVLEAASITFFYNTNLNIMPDIIILGFNQETDINNISILKAAKITYPLAKIVLYVEASGTSNPGGDLIGKEMIVNYLKIGVDGYLSKLNNLLELKTCINNVNNGRHYICSDALFFMLLIENEVVDKAVYQEFHQLTSRELEVARYLSDGMPTKIIAQKLDRAPSTISTTKANIFKKLKVDNVIKLRDIINLNTDPSNGFGNLRRS